MQHFFFAHAICTRSFCTSWRPRIGQCCGSVRASGVAETSDFLHFAGSLVIFSPRPMGASVRIHTHRAKKKAQDASHFINSGESKVVYTVLGPDTERGYVPFPWSTILPHIFFTCVIKQWPIASRPSEGQMSVNVFVKDFVCVGVDNAARCLSLAEAYTP